MKNSKLFFRRRTFYHSTYPLTTNKKGDIRRCRLCSVMVILQPAVIGGHNVLSNHYKLSRNHQW